MPPLPPPVVACNDEYLSCWREETSRVSRDNALARLEMDVSSVMDAATSPDG
jgi:hypothetical protein